MDRKQNSASFDVSFVALRFILRDAHPNQSANQAANRAADSQARESSHDRTGCNEGTDSRNRKNADTG